MKILFVTNLYPPAILGGYEILCEYVCGEFCSRGYEVVVQTSDFRTNGTKLPINSIGKNKEKIVRNLQLYLPFGKPARRARARHIAADVYNKKMTARLLVKEKPDIVFFWSLRRLSLGSVRAAIEAQVPYAMTMNDDYLLAYKPGEFSFEPRKNASYYLDRSLALRTTWLGLQFPKVTIISQSLLDNMIQQGAPIAHARVIYQGVDEKAFVLKDSPGSLHDPVRVLYAGQVHMYKGVHTVVESVAKLGEKNINIHLKIAGTGESEYRNFLGALAGRLKIADKVEFLGKVDREKLAELYKESDIFVFPSIWDEPFGLTHLEAMASGVPVISTTNGGPGEFLDHGVNALTFKAEDSYDLSDKIESLVKDNQLRKRIALAGRKCVEDNFTNKRYVDDLEQFIKTAYESWRN